MQFMPKAFEQEPRPPEQQISVILPMEILGMDLVNFRGQHALVTVNYYSCFLTSVTAVLNNIFGKFGLAEKIISTMGMLQI